MANLYDIDFVLLFIKLHFNIATKEILGLLVFLSRSRPMNSFSPVAGRSTGNISVTDLFLTG